MKWELPEKNSSVVDISHKNMVETMKMFDVESEGTIDLTPTQNLQFGVLDLIACPQNVENVYSAILLVLLR